MCRNSFQGNRFLVNRLYIERFRRFYQQSANLGERITLIAGQNGTSKSTLLGMIAQAFSFSKKKKGISESHAKVSVYTDNYDAQDFQYKTIGGKIFQSKFSEIFRLSKQYDNKGEHNYRLFIQGDDLTEKWLTTEGLPIKSRIRSGGSTPVRFVAGKTHAGGEGNFPHPVIYLGLTRLSPLANSSKFRLTKKSDLNEEEKNFLKEWHRKILCLTEEAKDTEIVHSGIPSKGDFIGTNFEDYDSEGCSAGQDNLGQILTSILSFKRLKKILGQKYKGGILLIDELDASFHAVAQKNLLEFLSKQAKELDIQIIATTHSLIILEHAYTSSLKEYTSILYLRRHNKEVFIKEYDTYELIEANLTNTLVRDVVPERRRNILFEDKLAYCFFNCLTHNKFKFGLFKFTNEIAEDGGQNERKSNSSANYLKWLSKFAPLKDTIKAIYILDSDQKEENFLKNTKNVLFLPSAFDQKIAFEKELFLFCKSLDDSSKFWNEEKNFIKSVLIQGYEHLSSETQSSDDFKNWFKGIISDKEMIKFIGRFGEKLIKLWVSHHMEISKEFCLNFIKSVSHVFGKNSLPNDIVDSLLSKYDTKKDDNISPVVSIDIKSTPLKAKKKIDSNPSQGILNL